MFEKIFAQTLAFIENKSVRLAVAALLLATLLVAFALAIVALSYDKNTGFHFEVAPQFKIAFTIAYIILFVSTWFILFLLNSKEGVDVYSEVRERIEGSWVVTYTENHGPISNQPVITQRTTSCTISIGPDKKLEMTFTIRNHPVFRDDTGQSIKDVAIRYGENGNYVMLYYYTTRLWTNPYVSSFLLPEEGKAVADEIELEIFGYVSFPRPKSGHKVKSMGGNWFDLNGNVSRIVALLDNKRVAEIRGEPFAAMRLSQVPIHQKYFDADMGRVEFSR